MNLAHEKQPHTLLKRGMKGSRRIICVALFLIGALGMPAFAEDKAFIDIVIRNTQGEEFRYSAELAHTPELRRKGLMYRCEFSSEEAMLFLWPVSARRLFWMKNTFIPLDILFFSEAGTLFHLVHMAEPESETLHSSHRLTAMVVELKGGEAKRLNIDIGSQITIESAVPEAR